MYKIKLKNVCDPYIEICLLWKKFFFNVFLNHFPKIHRSFLHKITIDLLYFWGVYDGNLWEKNLTEVWLINAEQIMSLYNFIILRKKETPAQVFFCRICETFKNSGSCFWKHVTYYYVIKNYAGHKLTILNTVLLLYCIYC